MKSMNKELLIIFFHLFLFSLYSSADGIEVKGARQKGMGGCSVALIDPFSVNNNQGALPFLKNNSAGIFFENRFLLSQLSTEGVFCNITTKGGAFGINLNHFGYSLFHETTAGVAYGHQFGNNFGAGIKLNYQNISLGNEYGSKGVLTFDIGLFTKITEKLALGVQVSNPLRPQITEQDKTSSKYTLGLAYSFGKSLIISSEVCKESEFKANLRAGLEYWLVKTICFRCGISTTPAMYSFGAGVRLKSLQIDFAAEISNILGTSPSIALTYTF